MKRCKQTPCTHKWKDRTRTGAGFHERSQTPKFVWQKKGNFALYLRVTNCDEFGTNVFLSVSTAHVGIMMPSPPNPPTSLTSIAGEGMKGTREIDE